MCFATLFPFCYLIFIMFLKSVAYVQIFQKQKKHFYSLISCGSLQNFLRCFEGDIHEIPVGPYWLFIEGIQHREIDIMNLLKYRDIK